MVVYAALGGAMQKSLNTVESVDNLPSVDWQQEWGAPADWHHSLLSPQPPFLLAMEEEVGPYGWESVPARIPARSLPFTALLICIQRIYIRRICIREFSALH